MEKINEFTCTLDEIIGKAVVIHVDAGRKAKTRLANLGVYPDVEVEVLLKSLGYIVLIKGSKFAIGGGLMKKIYAHIRLSDITEGKEYIIERIDEKLGLALGMKINSNYKDKYGISEEDAQNIYVVPEKNLRSKRVHGRHRHRWGNQ